MGGAQALKRIPRIKFPQRHPKLAGFESQTEAVPLAGDSSHAFFSGSKATTTNTLGGKASDQPQRTPVSKEEIEAILKCWNSTLFTTSGESFMSNQQSGGKSSRPFKRKELFS